MKGVANDRRLIVVTLVGRTHSGHIVKFAAGYLESESIAPVTRFLSYFTKFVF